MTHVPVLQKEVIEYLDPKPNENFIDCTIGQGGHAKLILEKNGPNGKILGIDHDPEIIKQLALRYKLHERMILVNGSYTNLKEIIENCNFSPIHGILFDLGMSSWHIDKSGKGFSFMRDEPLDMRYNQEGELTAEEIINKWPEREIEKILREYGEERFSRRIAQKIAEERKVKPIKTTFQLVEIIRKAVPKKFQHQRIHYAIPILAQRRNRGFSIRPKCRIGTRTFQALRITVNDELNNLKKGLSQAVDILTRGGRIVVISFQSLEDRIVKNFFREKAKHPAPEPPQKSKLSTGQEARYGARNIIKILTKKPIGPTEEEVRINPRSRSAKLRAAIKII